MLRKKIERRNRRKVNVFRNYLLIAIRNLFKHKLYALIMAQERLSLSARASVRVHVYG